MLRTLCKVFENWQLLDICKLLRIPLAISVVFCFANLGRLWCKCWSLVILEIYWIEKRILSKGYVLWKELLISFSLLNDDMCLCMCWAWHFENEQLSSYIFYNKMNWKFQSATNNNCSWLMWWVTLMLSMTLSCNGDDDDDELSWYSWVTNGSFCLVSITIRIQGRAICHPLYTSYAHLDATIISKINLNPQQYKKCIIRERQNWPHFM